MANSIQVSGGSVEVFNDLDLIAIICLLDLEVESQPGRHAAGATILSKWKRDLEGYGPGTIDLKISEMGSSDAAKSDLVSLLTAISEKADLYGKTVPAAVLNERCAPQGIKFYDFPVPLIKAAIARLKGLLSG